MNNNEKKKDLVLKVLRRAGPKGLTSSQLIEKCQKTIKCARRPQDPIGGNYIRNLLSTWKGSIVIRDSRTKRYCINNDSAQSLADASGSVATHPHKKAVNGKRTIEKGSLHVSNDFQYTYLEGGNREIVVVIPKRSSKAKAEKKKLGTTCCICGFDFEKAYGEIGEGFIHIHHIVQLADRKEEHVITLDDLRPVCPNCHAMLHRDQNNVLSIDQLKSKIKFTVNYQ